MIFSSVTFLFVFLPLFLTLYLLLPWRNAVALIFSLFFYAWGEGIYVLLLLFTVFANYFIGRAITRVAIRKLALGIGVGLNLCLLLYFKYFGFLVNDVLALQASNIDTPHLPLGISFFIFQSISYLVDVYRKDAREVESFSDIALYISMFPQLIAGPIVRYATVADAIKNRHVSIADVREGVALFVLGLSQKVLIANNVAEVADGVYAMNIASVDAITAWVGSLAYTLQIYFDFCGYSLMAMGIGRLMGFHFPRNFNYPYVSTSITEFWRRWHMSLSTWFRDYLYIPLGGNRKGPVRTYLNLLIVFFLCGLWHGASWTFVVWGIFHGLALIIERAGLSGFLAKLSAPIAHGYTLLMVIIGWVLFRAESFEQAKHFIITMFTPHGLEFSTGISQLVTNENLAAMVFGIIFSMPILPWAHNRLSTNSIWEKTGDAVSISVLAMLFFACTIYIMAGTYNPFIYFRF